MYNSLTQEEKESILDFPGFLMTREEYLKFIEEWEKDCEEEIELHKSFPY